MGPDPFYMNWLREEDPDDDSLDDDEKEIDNPDSEI